jgi:hypothetical protein
LHHCLEIDQTREETAEEAKEEGKEGNASKSTNAGLSGGQR